MSALRPEEALSAVAESLRRPETVISPHVRPPEVSPVLGTLAAAGPASRRARGEYAVVVESVLEGYLLHHGVPRVLGGHDRDLALLAGDYLYALGLRRLGRLGDDGAVAELSDLISLAAEANAEDRRECLEAVWLAGAVAVACGAGEEVREAKEAMRMLEPSAAGALRESARITAERAGMGSAFGIAEKAIDFPAVEGPSLD